MYNNTQALEKLKSFHPKKNLPTAYEDDPRQFGADLRIAGVRCSECGGYVTGPNLKFFNFEPDVKCYNCQKL